MSGIRRVETTFSILLSLEPYLLFMTSPLVLEGRLCCYSNALHILVDSLQFYFF